jgi:hypothetical protein
VAQVPHDAFPCCVPPKEKIKRNQETSKRQSRDIKRTHKEIIEIKRNQRNIKRNPENSKDIEARRLLEPMPENSQIESPGCHFVDFWSQGQTTNKSNILDILLSTFGAKARKY